MAYVTKTEIEQYTGLSIAETMTSFLTKLTTAVQNFVENYTGRWFEDDDEAATRYYDGNGCTKLAIDDIREITSIEVDGIALVADDDYYTYPLNATEDGVPIERIDLIQPETKVNTNSRAMLLGSSNYIFEKKQRSVKITGKWGYSTVPPEDIKLAVLKLIGGVIKENIGDADVKEVTSETIGAFTTSYAKLKDIAHALGVEDLLDPYVRTSTKPKAGFIVAS